MASSLVQRNKVVRQSKGALAAATAAGPAWWRRPVGPSSRFRLAGAVYLTWDWFSSASRTACGFYTSLP